MLGEEPLSILISMANLSHILWKAQKHSEKALLLMLDTVRRSEKVTGTGHPDTISRKETLNRWLDATKL